MSDKKFRVGILGIYHESNTFITEPTTLTLFEQVAVCTGEAIRTKYEKAHHELGGFFQALDASEIEAVPVFFARATPWGSVDDEALDTLWAQCLAELDKVGPLDGILAGPHGAGVNTSRPDMDGWWLTELRKKVGEIPIIATMDPHGNLSEAMVEACDALIAYRQNPHLDMRQRGIEAGELMVRTLRKEIVPTMAGAFPPLAINIERQWTEGEPMLTVRRELDRVRALPGVLSASVTLGFPYADVSDMGSAFIVVTDNDPALAKSLADQLGAWLMENRTLFLGEMISPEEAFARIEDAPKPVGLLDMGDNLGGGAPGDSTVLARLFHEDKRYRVFVFFPDPEGVQAAKKAGIGNTFSMKLGGKLDMSPAEPIETEVKVLGIYDGKYTETQPRHGGVMNGNTGETVIVETPTGLTAMLTSRRSGPTSSIQPIYACGLRPEDFDVLIIRGVHAPVGGYQEVCPTLIRVNTPGVSTADMSVLDYRHRRRPLYPLEDF